jgi:hypothetical protein
MDWKPKAFYGYAVLRKQSPPKSGEAEEVEKTLCWELNKDYPIWYAEGLMPTALASNGSFRHQTLKRSENI